MKNRIELGASMQEEISKYKSADLLNYCHTHFIPSGEIKDLRKVFESPLAKTQIIESTIENQPIKVVKSVAFKIRH